MYRNFYSRMKRFILASAAALLCCSAFSQQIRTNYRSGGFTHISTDYQDIKLAEVPSRMRVELVGLPDGSSFYVIYMNLLQKETVVAPKGVKMSATLPGGKFVRLEQIGQNAANKLKYAAEPADMEKLVRGVKSVDIVTGWNPDDFIQASFPSDEFAKLLKSHCDAIVSASSKTIELTATLASYTDNANSVMTAANPIVARGKGLDYNVILSHLYYKDSGEEDVDLAFVVGSTEKYHFPIDSPVRFTLRDGSVISLLQARDDINFIYVYPSMEDLYRMADIGIASISIEYEDGTLEDTIPASDEDFSAALGQQLQLLLSISGRN